MVKVLVLVVVVLAMVEQEWVQVEEIDGMLIRWLVVVLVVFSLELHPSPPPLLDVACWVLTR